METSACATTFYAQHAILGEWAHARSAGARSMRRTTTSTALTMVTTMKVREPTPEGGTRAWSPMGTAGGGDSGTFGFYGVVRGARCGRAGRRGRSSRNGAAPRVRADATSRA